MSRQPTHKEKTLRAFGAYLELLDTAEWFEREMRAPLASFDLTMAGFRLLELLYRVEIMTIPDLARRRGAVRQTIDAIVARLVERGWVRRMLIALPPVDPEGRHLAKSKRNERRVGVRVGVVKLTPAGKRLVRDMLPHERSGCRSRRSQIDGPRSRIRRETTAEFCRLDTCFACSYSRRMEVQLTPDQKAFVRQAIESGRISREEDAVKEALSLWEERERARAEMLASIDEAETSLARGGGRVLTPETTHELAEDVKRRGRARLAAERPTPR